MHPPPASSQTSSVSGSLLQLWQAYLQDAPTADETRRAGTAGPAAWQRFFHETGQLSSTDLRNLEHSAARLFREHGATFHTHTEAGEGARPWELDPIPLVLDNEEWSWIERGLQQRVHLLNLVLEDLYGPRRLLSSGLLPQDLILRHPDFLRPCATIPHPSASRVFTYAADLARGPAGRMWVINDRTGCPPGMGHALENRTIMGKLFPDAFQALGVQRLSQTFRSMRAGLRDLAPDAGPGDPRIVFHTPGPYSPSYFEHAYLAAYLGYTLVQRDDLLVREGRLWLKALEGLQPVQVVIRRVNDAFCDPLELRADSLLGVPGLLEAVRRHTVVVANPVGSQLLENPGLFPFLPGIARAWLNEDLILPHAATWWCGHARERQHVLANLDSLVVKSIDRSPLRIEGTWVPAPFPPGPELVQAIQRDPWRYVGQERVQFSTAPVLADGRRLEARVITLRAFVTRTGGGDMQALPGGLARCGSLEQTYLPSKPFGGICKDTWVLSGRNEPHVSLWTERHEEDRQAPFDGLYTSSAAESLFWTGRYGERARCLIHTLRVLLKARERENTGGLGGSAALWQALLRQTGCTEPAAASVEAALRWVDLPDEPGGVPSALRSFYRSAYAVRENWSVDTWRILTQLQELGPRHKPRSRAKRLSTAQALLDQLLLLFQAFSGQSFESMTRTPGWQFLNVGRHLERALMMCDFLMGALSVPLEANDVMDPLETILEVYENLVTYRRAYRTTPEYPTVMHLLLAQPSNPRSLTWSLTQLSEGLHAVVASTGHTGTRAIAERVTESNRSLCHLPNEHWRLSNVHILRTHLQELYERLLASGGELSHAHFQHVHWRLQSPGWVGGTRQ